MVYTVTMNPSLDYIVSVDGFLAGSVNRTCAEHIFAGGKGINVSMVLKNLGYESIALGFLAGFTGEKIAELLKQDGIRQDFIMLPEGFSRINVKIRSDEESEINGKGPVPDGASAEKLYRKLDQLKAGDFLVLAGSIPAGMQPSAYTDIMHRLKGRGLHIVVDASGSLLRDVLPCHPFLVKPNHEELGELFGARISTRREAAGYAQELRKQGADNVLVSMAGMGAVLAAEDGCIYESEAPKGHLRNSVGAGDSMVAGFIAGFLESGDYRTAFRLGLCTGSASAFSEHLAAREDVLSLFRAQFSDSAI